MRSPAAYEADHADRLAELDDDPCPATRAGARAHAREKTVHNLPLRTATTTTST
jgi:hypothetical protein